MVKGEYWDIASLNLLSSRRRFQAQCFHGQLHGCKDRSFKQVVVYPIEFFNPFCFNNFTGLQLFCGSSMVHLFLSDSMVGSRQNYLAHHPGQCLESHMAFGAAIPKHVALLWAISAPHIRHEGLCVCVCLCVYVRVWVYQNLAG